MLRNGGACKIKVDGTSEQVMRDYNRLPWLKETDIGQPPSKAIALLSLSAEGAEVTDAGLQRTCTWDKWEATGACVKHTD